MDRRQFLEFSAASLSITTSLTLSGCGGGSSGNSNPVPANPKPDNGNNGNNADALWQTLATSMTGSLIRPGNNNYELSRLVYNARFDEIKPQAIAQCASENDIRLVLAFAQKIHCRSRPAVAAIVIPAPQPIMAS